MPASPTPSELTVEPPGQPSRLRRLRPPGGLSGLDLRNTWQAVAGAILLPLGVAVILLGWSGAAHGRVDQQQIPYLISGGVLGLAVVVIGCFFYWAHWLYRLYDQADLHHREAMREQQEMMRALIDALDRRPAGEAAVRVGGNGDGRHIFVATPAGTNFHNPGCPMVAGRTESLRTVTDSEARQMKPCRVCEPLASAN